MAQFFGIETIKELEKSSPTTIVWPSGSNLRIGGKAYITGSDLTMDLTLDIDTGSVIADTYYYVYAIVIGGTVSLKYSLSNSAPTGYAAYRKIGIFKTNSSAEIIGVSSKDEGRVGDIKHSRLTEEQFIEQNGAGWILYDGSDITGTKLASIISLSVLEDARGQFLRAKNNSRSDGNENPDGDVALGTWQADELGNHRHSISGRAGKGTSNAQPVTVSDNYTSTAYTDYEGGNETRPKNLTVNIFIKVEDLDI